MKNNPLFNSWWTEALSEKDRAFLIDLAKVNPKSAMLIAFEAALLYERTKHDSGN